MSGVYGFEVPDEITRFDDFQTWFSSWDGESFRRYIERTIFESRLLIVPAFTREDIAEVVEPEVIEPETAEPAEKERNARG